MIVKTTLMCPCWLLQATWCALVCAFFSPVSNWLFLSCLKIFSVWALHVRKPKLSVILSFADFFSQPDVFHNLKSPKWVQSVSKNLKVALPLGKITPYWAKFLSLLGGRSPAVCDKNTTGLGGALKLPSMDVWELIGGPMPNQHCEV